MRKVTTTEPTEDTILRDGKELLDQVEADLLNGRAEEGMDRLFGGLLDLRERYPEPVWKDFARGAAMDHSLRSRIHQDPMTRRSFEKPRGYAGDAVLLDFIYGLCEPDGTSGAGRLVYDFAASRPAASAVRWRKRYIARELDELARRKPGEGRVLSIASGHLREAAEARDVEELGLAEFVAVDSDEESMELVRSTLPQVVGRPEPFTALFRDRSLFGRFDFVYSAGLYDYLQDKIACKLTALMFRMLRPGGKLLLTNFLPTVVDAGYMESFMGWDLIYRTRTDLRALAADCPANEVASIAAWADSQRTIGYLEVQKT